MGDNFKPENVGYVVLFYLALALLTFYLAGGC